MFVAEDMYQLGSQRSAIRELFEYGKQRAAVVGAENVYDFSLGNPTVPAPDCVNETIRDLTHKLDSISLHGYTSAQGDIETRQAIIPAKIFIGCGAFFHTSMYTEIPNRNTTIPMPIHIRKKAVPEPVA